MRLSAIAGAIALALPALAVGAPAGRVEFNEAFLQAKAGTDVDLARFAQPDFIAPGTYLVDVYVNGRYVKQTSVRFDERMDGSVMPCVDAALLEGFPFREDAIAVPAEGCGALDAVEGATIAYRKADARLEVVLPQAILTRTYDRYVPPSQWDDGIAAVLLDYRLAYQHVESTDRASDSFTAYGVLGANSGPWRLRGNYQFQDGSQREHSKLDWSDVTLSRDLRDQGARLTLGRSHITSNVFDSLRFDGAKVETDERMLPQALRGYAPRVEGIARSYAKVTIHQNGRLLYVENVPPGPFVIDDVSSAAQGELTVTVEESDGPPQVFTVVSTSVPFMARKGAVRYSAAVGQPIARRIQGRVDDLAVPGRNDDVHFAFGEASYGLTDATSVYGATIVAEGYTSAAAGVARNAGRLGAFSLDATRAWADLERTRAGNSYRFTYAKQMQEPNIDLHVFGYRFSDSDFVAFDRFVDLSHQQATLREKNRVAASLATHVSGFSISVTGQRSRYWNADSTTTFGVSLSRYARMFDRNVGFNLSLQRTEGLSGVSDGDSAYFSVSVPLDSGSSVRSSVRRSMGRSGADVAWSGSAGGNSVSLSAGVDENDPALSASLYREASAYALDASTSRFGDSQRSWSLGLRSSLLLHAGGLTASNSSQGATRILVNTQGVPDVPLLYSAAKTNRKGYAVLGWVPPYELNDLRVDTDLLPGRVEVHNPFQRRAFTDGAVGRVDFDVSDGAPAFVRLLLDGFRPLPLGASLFDGDTGRELGIVSEDGTAFVSGMTPNTRLRAEWAGSRCEVPAGPIGEDLTQATERPCHSIDLHSSL